MRADMGRPAGVWFPLDNPDQLRSRRDIRFRAALCWPAHRVCQHNAHRSTSPCHFSHPHLLAALYGRAPLLFARA